MFVGWTFLSVPPALFHNADFEWQKFPTNVGPQFVGVHVLPVRSEMSLIQAPPCCVSSRLSRISAKTRFRLMRPIFSLGWLACCFAAGSAALAQTEGSKLGEAQQWALLIGVEKYEKAHPLQFTVNDVEQLAKTLEIRGGMAKSRILKITDNAPASQHRPSKANLQTELPKWLKQVGPNEQILVYFSGHGFRDKEGKLYLAPIDIDPANPADTGVPVEWFREQIAACPAAFKLLVIDACHAGSEKGVQEDGVTSKELGDVFKGLQQVMTLASSAADEKSQIWDDRRQSLFSYWLNQGLKGHADKDGNGAVTIDELYDYVSRTVKHTAETRFPRKQTPVRIIHAGTDGVPVIVQLQPQGLKEVLADIAEQLAFAVEEHQLLIPDEKRTLPKLGVLQFMNNTPQGESVGEGSIGQCCSDELWRQLMVLKQGKFELVDPRKLQEAASEKEFTISDLGSTVEIKDLSAKADGMTFLVTGILRYRKGGVITLQCTLGQTDSDVVVGSAGGTAFLKESEWPMLGHSVAPKPEDRPAPAPPGAGMPVVAPTVQVIQRLDELAQGPHPLLDPNFPFRVWIKAGTVDATGQLFYGQKREPVFRGNDCFVPVRKGEVLQIWVENNSGELVLMRLLVDGLNTLPEIIANNAVGNGPPREIAPSAPWITRSQQVVVENGKPKGIVTYEWGAHVNLNEARHWGLDPKDEVLNGGPPMWVINGFVTKTGEDGLLNRFKVVDANQSLAARRQFTDQLGLITAAFYAPAGMGRGSLGIEAGPEMKQKLKEQKSPPPGNLLGVVQIRYVDADTLANAGR